ERRAGLALQLTWTHHYTDRDAGCGEIRFQPAVGGGAAAGEERDVAERILGADGERRVGVARRPDRAVAGAFVAGGGDDDDAAPRGGIDRDGRDRDVAVQIGRLVGEVVVEDEIGEARGDDVDA